MRIQTDQFDVCVTLDARRFVARRHVLALLLWIPAHNNAPYTS